MFSSACAFTSSTVSDHVFPEQLMKSREEVKTVNHVLRKVLGHSRHPEANCISMRSTERRDKLVHSAPRRAAQRFPDCRRA